MRELREGTIVRISKDYPYMNTSLRAYAYADLKLRVVRCSHNRALLEDVFGLHHWAPFEYVIPVISELIFEENLS